MRPSRLGDQELEVLRYIAENGAATVGQVAEGFGSPRGLARSTVLTVMERLRKKGYLARVQRAGVFHYASNESEAVVLRDVVASFVNRCLSGSVSPFAAYLADAADVSDSELAELEATVAKLQAKRRQDGE